MRKQYGTRRARRNERFPARRARRLSVWMPVAAENKALNVIYDREGWPDHAGRAGSPQTNQPPRNPGQFNTAETA
jgi:hypothetical protein